MSKIVPLGGAFKDWRALLARIAEDDEVQALVICTFTKDGTMKAAHLGTTYMQIAYAAAHWIRIAGEQETEPE
jgi:hypothetical protein